MSTDQYILTAPLCLILAVATVIDWRAHRIPNVLSFGAAFFALVLRGNLNGMDGILDAAAGYCLCLVLFLPFYLKRGMAAGDVKLMAAVGAFLGPFSGLLAGLFTVIAGGLIGLASIGVAWSASRLASSAGEHTFTLREALRTRIPYAGAIAAGTSVVLFLPGVVPVSLI
jgi:prepilin peptidase CpaA